MRPGSAGILAHCCIVFVRMVHIDEINRTCSALGAPASRRLTVANIGNSQINQEIAAVFANFEEKIKLIVKASRRGRRRSQGRAMR
jgi:hypothetical protein